MREEKNVESFGAELTKYSTVFYKKGFPTGEPKASITVADEDKQCCAKAIHNLNNESVRVFAKLGMDGTLADPYATEFARQRRGFYKWTKVTNDAFKLYVKFLRTGSRTCLHQAERER